MNLPEARKICPSCRRAGITCYCAGIQPFEAAFALVLLVHPKEARNRVGTVRITQLSVKGSELIVGRGDELDQDPQFLSILQDPTLYPAVLFPGEGSQAIETMKKEWIPSGKRLALFVIDGTWSQAKHMIRSSRALSALPRIAFIPDQPSRYEFREQPKPYCLSTVEAVHTVIERMDRAGIYPAPQNREHDGMLRVFRDLVKCQLAYGKIEEDRFRSR